MGKEMKEIEVKILENETFYFRNFDRINLDRTTPIIKTEIIRIIINPAF